MLTALLIAEAKRRADRPVRRNRQIFAELIRSGANNTSGREV
jgi:hypothetical protein